MNHSEHMQHTSPDFFALWRPEILLVLIAISALYFYFTGAGRSLFQGSAPVSTSKKTLFVIAILLIYAAQGSPINYYGHAHLFSSHMLQQSILFLMVPPLLYAALPAWMVRPVLEKPWPRRWIYPLMHPLLGVIVFNMLFSMYHFPTVFNAVYEIPWLHTSYHWLLLLTAFHMWFPVFCPLPEWNRISDLQRMAYIFANGVLLTPACALIIFSGEVIYDVYRQAPLVISFLPPLYDQQMGGTIMKILQEVVYGIVLAFVFFRWYRTERTKEVDDLNEIETVDNVLPSKHLPSH